IKKKQVKATHPWPHDLGIHESPEFSETNPRMTSVSVNMVHARLAEDVSFNGSVVGEEDFRAEQKALMCNKGVNLLDD
ncbi:hypothetical protein S83_015923, partial [Arachis hypogaea]